jgi:hypothetical protein
MILPTHEPEFANPASIERSLGGAQHDHIELTLGQKTPCHLLSFKILIRLNLNETSLFL